MLVKPPPSGPKTLSLSTDLRIWQKDRPSATAKKIPATQLHGHNIDPTYPQSSQILPLGKWRCYSKGQ